MMHLYCLAVQAGFYSDAVECRTLSPADRVSAKTHSLRMTCYLPTTTHDYILLVHSQCLENVKTVIRRPMLLLSAERMYTSTGYPFRGLSLSKKSVVR